MVALPPDIEPVVNDARTFLDLMKSNKRIWIALAVAGFIGFVAGAIVF